MLLGFVLVLMSYTACVSPAEFSTQNPMIMDDMVNNIDVMVDTVLDMMGENMTNNINDTVDVEDVVVNGNGTFLNGTDGNSTWTIGPDVTTQAAVNPECLWYQQNPFWRLTATKQMNKHYLCVCFKLCFDEEELKRLNEAALANRTQTNVFQRNSFFMFYFMFIMYILAILLGTSGNILVIVGILGIMKDKTVVNRFVVSLAVADLFMSMFITPIKMLYLVEVMKTMKETWLCKIMLYMRQLAQTEAIVILTIIAFERYYAICHPLKAKFRCSMKRCHVLIVISWFVSLIIALPSVLQAEYKADRGSGAICTIHYDSSTWLQIHYVYFLIVLLLIPTVIMSFAYVRICYVLWLSTKKAAELTNQDGKADKTPSDIQSRIKVIKTMVGLMVVFLICWGPRLSFNVAAVFHLEMVPKTKYYGDLIAELLANGHSLINPLMFIACSQPFRRALAKCLPRWCCGLSLKSTASGKSSTMFSGQTMSSTDMKSTDLNGSTHM